jgi:hypothetical protein
MTMTKNTTNTEKMQARISAAIKKAAPAVVATYAQGDESTQAELRLSARWAIRLAVDEISAPRDLANTDASRELWSLWFRLVFQGTAAADLGKNRVEITEHASARSKTGQGRRAMVAETFTLSSGRQFLAELQKATGKRNLSMATAKITALQAEQKKLLPQLRKSNSEHLADLKSAKATERAADTAALTSGEFWLASKEALKNYFHPPFDKNYLADVSERWRAALYLECESVSYKTGYGWRHKLAGTGRAYLCGIDDNGDEWGHEIRIELSHDDHYNQRLDATVEEAMAELFDVSVRQLADCHRQGDLLFRPCAIQTQAKTICSRCGEPEASHKWVEELDLPRTLTCYGDIYAGEFAPRTITPPTMEAEQVWEVRESHKITSPSLRHNGKYFAADDRITVEHTSHQPVILPPGEWCLHMLQIADAD